MNKITGLAGKYFVAAELSKREYLVKLTKTDGNGMDISVSSADKTKLVNVQVRTTKTTKRRWKLRKEAELLIADNLFYVFVMLNEIGEQPSYYIVPSQEVAAYVTNDHQTWLDTPRKDGQAHGDNDLRIFTVADEGYRDKWDLLGL